MDYEKKTKIKRSRLIFVLVLIFVVIAITVICFILFNQKKEVYKSTDRAMGTDVKQTIYGDNTVRITKAVLNQINELEEQISWKKQNSQIQKINENAGIEEVDLSSDVFDVLSKSQEVSNLSGGAFDLTVLPISKLWNPEREDRKVPAREAILEKLKLVDYKFLEINKDSQKAKLLKKGAIIGLDGVCEGAACNCAIDQLKKMRPTGGIVSVGRSIVAFGKKSDEKFWKIAIRDPFKRANDENNSFGTLECKEGHVCTSGALEDNFNVVGRSFQDVLDPRIGYPIENDIACVTVAHKDGVITNALALACRVLGREKSLPLLEHYSAGAIFVDRQKQVFWTDNLKENFKITDNGFSKI